MTGKRADTLWPESYVQKPDNLKIREGKDQKSVGRDGWFPIREAFSSSSFISGFFFSLMTQTTVFRLLSIKGQYSQERS